jgi:hypothetical protein
MRINLSVILLLASAADGLAQETEWLVAPYLWYADITLEQASGGGGGISGSDLLDMTDAFGMIRIEGARNHWGATFDYIFLGLSDDRRVNVPDPFGQVNLRGEVDLTVIEFAGFYRWSGDESGVHALFGLRNISVDKLLLVTPELGGPTQRFEGDDDFTDVMLGARYLHRFNDRWDLAARADYSFGDSEGTINLIGTVGFRFNDLFAINGGYRYASLEYEDSDPNVAATTTLDLSGPILGFLFRF